MTRRTLLLACCAGFALACGPRPATARDAHNVSELAHWFNGPCRVVKLAGGIVHVGNGMALDLADLNDGGAPRPLGKVALPATVEDLAVADGLIAAALGTSGCAMTPAIRASRTSGRSVEAGADVRGVALGDGVAYLADLARTARGEPGDPASPS
jgi:hypothetical protein